MTAVVHEINGQLVLVDPEAAAMIMAVEKYNCRSTLVANFGRVFHFKRRIAEIGMSPKDAVIVVLNVDDPHGGPLADVLMPGFDWQSIRDRGEVPFARGLAGRDGIQEVVDKLDRETGDELRSIQGTAVVVMDHGVVTAYALS